MTSIHYLAGGNVDARQRLIDEKLSLWNGGPVLHLVPTSGRVIELESDHRFWLKRRQDTLTGLVYKIFEENIRFKQFRDHRPIDTGVRSLIVKKALEKRMTQPEGLIYFDRLLADNDQDLDFPGIFRAISSFFSQLVRNCYQDRFVNDLAGKIIRAEEKGVSRGEDSYALESDLAWLFGEYEEIKREIGVYDEDDVLSSVRDFLSCHPMPFPVKGTGVIIFDGFIHFTKIEEEILYHLFSQVDQVWWPVDHTEKGEQADSIKTTGVAVEPKGNGMEAYRIFAAAGTFTKRLETGGFEIVPEKCGEAVYLNPLAQGLYIDGLLRETDNNTLRIKYFPGKTEEVKAIAREIKRIIHDDRLDAARDLGRIRIVFPELNEYSSLISEIFREYGIPLSLTRGLPLVSHPLSNLFLLMFKLPLDNFKRENVFQLFSSDLITKMKAGCPYAGNEHLSKILAENLLPGDDLSRVEPLIREHFEKKPVAAGVDFELIDRVAQTCGINYLGDDVSWQDKGISSVRDFYCGKKAKTMGPEERNVLSLEYYGFLIHRSLLADTLKPFKNLIEQESPHSMETVFCDLLNGFGLPDNIAEPADPAMLINPFVENRMIRRDLKVYALLNDLVSLSASELTIDTELFSIKPGRELLSKFFRVFRNRLADSYLLDEQDPNVIRVSQWLEIRGRSFDYIFAGGLTDKNFPLKEEKNFIFPEPSRSIFRIPDSIDMSRHLFSHLLRNYRKGLYLSCPGFADEKEVRPSNVFADIESMRLVNFASPMENGTIKNLFPWEDSPYLSSGHELLDSSIAKGDHEPETAGSPFRLKDVIITDERLLEGVLRGLRAMGSRWALNGLFEYDGLTEKAGRFQEFIKSKKNIFSASQLETLANCPMCYLFERVYGLKKMETTGPDATPMAMGEHLHGLLSVFFRRLQDQGKNVSGIGIDQAFSQAKAAADEYFRANPFLERIEFFEHQKNEFLAGLENNTEDQCSGPASREGAFALLLRFEEKNFMDRIPDGIEYAFGFDGEACPLLGKVRLRGFIDRFDRDQNDQGRFYIYDYKTGSLPSSVLIKKGLSFQLPVYINALKKCLKARGITAALYTIRKDILLKEGPLGQDLCDNGADTAGLDITGVTLVDRYADRLMELLDAGRFHHSADMVNCDYCDFRYACHRDERRMDHLTASMEDHGIYSGEKNLETWKEVDKFRGEWKKILESMKKAFNLKTASGRKNHYESVLTFEQKLVENRDSQPFESGYIDELLREIEAFKIRWKG